MVSVSVVAATLTIWLWREPGQENVCLTTSGASNTRVLFSPSIRVSMAPREVRELASPGTADRKVHGDTRYASVC